MTYPWHIKKGTFTSYMHQEYGKKAFTKDGKLKIAYVNKVIASKKATEHRKRQARFVKNARKFKHK